MRAVPWQIRLWEKAALPDENGCILWMGAISRDGYGSLGRGRGTCLAHRASYELAYGAIPGDLPLDHLCRVRRCINPLHLEPVTVRENNLRGVVYENRRTQPYCKWGHEYTPENTAHTQQGHRVCRTCTREQGRKKDAKRQQQGVCPHCGATMRPRDLARRHLKTHRTAEDAQVAR